jgi:hypothetical protein
MNRMRVRLWVVMMLLALLVAPGLLHARPVTDEGKAARAAEPSILGQAWHWLVAMVGQGGSFIDPLGTTDPNSNRPGTGVQTNGGSFIDPLGGEH